MQDVPVSRPLKVEAGDYLQIEGSMDEDKEYEETAKRTTWQTF